MYIYIYMYVCMYVCIYIYIYIYALLCIYCPVLVDVAHREGLDAVDPPQPVNNYN